jgi:AcrR family transcriptional regulator
MPTKQSSMRKLPTQKRSKERVEKIISTTLEYMAEEGVDSLTCAKVAERANLPSATIYQFFPNKESILEVVAERWLAANMETLEHTDPRQGQFANWQQWLEAAIDGDYATYQNQQALLALTSVMSVTPHLKDIERKHDAIIKARIAEGIGYFFSQLDQSTILLLAEMTMSVSHATLLKAAEADETQSLWYKNNLKFMLLGLYAKYAY